MPISDLDNILLLIQRVGDVDPVSGDPVPVLATGGSGIVMINSDRIWNKYASYKSIQPAAIGSEIFDTYFMLTAQQLVTAVLAERITFSAVGTAVRVNLSDRWAHHNAQMDALRQDLATLFQRAAAYGAPAMVAPILAIMPILPPVPGQLPTPLWQIGQASVFTYDANSYTLYGSPYWSEWRRW